MANLKDVIYLSNEDYETLVSTGTVTIDGETLTYDENTVYITPEKQASQTQDGLMSAEDKAKLDGIESHAEENVQSDWNQTDSTADDYIKNKPTIPGVNDGQLTIKSNGVTSGTFTANQSTNTTIDLKTAEVIDVTNGVTLDIKNKLTNNPAIMLKYEEYYYVAQYDANGSGFSVPTYYNCFEGDGGNGDFRWLEIDWENLTITSDVVSYATRNEIPTVNNGTLTIQKNGTQVATFTANQSGNVTANIAVPTRVTDLIDASNYINISDTAQAKSGSLTLQSYLYMGLGIPSNGDGVTRYPMKDIILNRRSGAISGFYANSAQWNRFFGLVYNTKYICTCNYKGDGSAAVSTSPEGVWTARRSGDSTTYSGNLAYLFDSSFTSGPTFPIADLSTRPVVITVTTTDGSNIDFSDTAYIELNGWRFDGQQSTYNHYGTLTNYKLEILLKKVSDNSLVWVKTFERTGVSDAICGLSFPVWSSSMVPNASDYSPSDSNSYKNFYGIRLTISGANAGGLSGQFGITELKLMETRPSGKPSDGVGAFSAMGGTLYGDLILTSKYSDMSIRPQTNNTGYLGTSSYQWDKVYSRYLYENGTSLANKYQLKLPTTTTAGKVLKSTSASGIVEWGDASGGVTDVKIGTTSIVSGGIATIPSASATQSGIVNISNQTFAGDKLFNGEVITRKHVLVYGDDDDGDDYKPSNLTGFTDLDTFYYNTGVTLFNGDTEDVYEISFPAKNGTFALTSDFATETSNNQSTTVLIRDATTNINGWYLSTFREQSTTLSGYTVTIVSDSQTGTGHISNERAKVYMKAMTGSEFVPMYDYNAPKQVLFVDASGTIWKPQYMNTGAGVYNIVLFKVSSVATNLENGTGTNALQQKGNTASGKDSFAQGLGNTASNIQTHAEGFTTQAVGNFAHSEGQYTVAHADISHTEGVGNVVGDLTQVAVRDRGQGGHAEGLANLVLGQYAHAEGANNVAKGDYSHANGIGGNDWANPQNSEIAITEFDEVNYIKNTSVGHGISYDSTNNITYFSGARFGDGTQTFSEFVSRLNANSTVKVIHSSGTEQELTVHNKGTDYFYLSGKVEWLSGDSYLSVEFKQADGDVASGTAYGTASYVGGFHNVAMQDYQTVVGKYNQNKFNTLFEVGNGTSNSSRSNAFEVYADGHAEVALMGSNDKSVATKLYVDSKVALVPGTVTSVRVQAGTGLSSSQSTAQTSILNTTISIASGYKLPTNTQWNTCIKDVSLNGTTLTFTKNDNSTIVINLPSGGQSSGGDPNIY